jgi:hypothetical protein
MILFSIDLKGLGGQGYGVQRHFQQYFSYIMAVSFIGGENRSTLKIQYTELKLSYGNDSVVKNYIYSNGDLDL